MKRDFRGVPSATAQGPSVLLVRDPAGLEALGPDWEDLAANAVEPNAFYEPALLMPALHELGAGQDVSVVCVWYRGRLGALFPCRLVSRYKGMPATALVAWRHRHCPVSTPLLRTDCAAECLTALFQWLRRERAASLIDFHYLAAGAPFHQVLVDVLDETGLRVLLRDSYSRALLCRAPDAESYLRSSLSAQLRNRLRRTEKRLREHGEVSKRLLKTGDDIDRWIEEFLVLEDGGWKGRNGSSFAKSERHRRFAREALTRAFNRQRLLMVGLDLAGRPIARYCAFKSGEGSFAFKTAYDEQFARFSPGILAHVEMIRAFHDSSGLKWMDSATSRNNYTIDRLWKDRRVMEHLVVGNGAWGELALSMLQLAQSGKRLLGRLARRRSPPSGAVAR